MLGEPAFVAAHHRRDAQREALLAEQRVAAVARAVRPDLARLGKVHDVLVLACCTASARRAAPGASGAPTECTQGTNGPSLPSTSYTARPMRVMMRMLTATYGLSESSTPICAIGLPIGPIENGTTYIVRPRMQPSNRPFERARASRAGATPVVRRAGVVLALAADERAVLDARDVGRIRAREVAARALRRIERDEACPPRPSRAHRRSYSAVAAVAPDDALGLGEARRSRGPSRGAAGVARTPGRPRMRRAWQAIRFDSSLTGQWQRDSCVNGWYCRGGARFCRRARLAHRSAILRDLAAWARGHWDNLRAIALRELRTRSGPSSSFVEYRPRRLRASIPVRTPREHEGVASSSTTSARHMERGDQRHAELQHLRGDAHLGHAAGRGAEHERAPDDSPDAHASDDAERGRQHDRQERR